MDNIFNISTFVDNHKNPLFDRTIHFYTVIAVSVGVGSFCATSVNISEPIEILVTKRQLRRRVLLCDANTQSFIRRCYKNRVLTLCKTTGDVVMSKYLHYYLKGVIDGPDIKKRTAIRTNAQSKEKKKAKERSSTTINRT